ncbi:MAG: sialidase family protein [Actinomycetota bacterium]
MRMFRAAIAVFLLMAAAVATSGSAGQAAPHVRVSAPTAVAVSSPLDITNDQFANNEESLGMSPDGQLLAGAWNDWEFNDGCGFSYSTDAGASWAPESFVPGFTFFTNDPDVPGTGPFAVAGDPSVAYNPASGLFDVICQSFGGRKGNQIQLLSTTFDPSQADPNADVNSSYGLDAWRLPAVAVTTGTSNGSQKGSNGQFPDHETIAVDTGTGPGHHFGRLYVTWAQFSGLGRSPIDVAFSDDDGATWQGPIRISDRGHQFDQDARAAVGPDGAVYVTWINGPNEKSLKNNTAMVAKSTDGGRSWSRDHVAASIVAPIGGLLPNSEYRVFEDVWPAVDQATGKLVVGFTDEKSGAANIEAVHTALAGDLSSFTNPVRVKPSGQEEFFPWLSSASNGRVDLVFYDRSCDPAHDTKNCVTLASTDDSGATWGITPMTTTGFDGDQFEACLAFVDPQPTCGNPFLGDYIAVASNDSTAQVLYTGNGASALDVFSQHADF